MTAGDFNNDGYQDCYVSNYRLFEHILGQCAEERFVGVLARFPLRVHRTPHKSFFLGRTGYQADAAGLTVLDVNLNFVLKIPVILGF